MAKKAAPPKKGTTGKKMPGKKLSIKQSGAGLSEQEHGQAWERDQHIDVDPDETDYDAQDLNGGPDDEDDTDPEDE